MCKLSKRPSKDNTAGFTLVELMIVVAIIAILAGVTVPSLMGARARTNETAVIGLLRIVSSGNTTIRSQVSIDTDGNGVDADLAPDCRIDTDGNGVGEFGWLGELAGVVPVRTQTEKIHPTALSQHLGEVDANGMLSRNGYYFMLYLPDSTGNGLAETAANTGSIDGLMATNFFTFVAWPQAYGQSGQRTFFVNQMGEIITTVDPNYSGLSGVPAPNCALIGMSGNEINSNVIASTGQIATDGNRWKIIP